MTNLGAVYLVVKLVRVYSALREGRFYAGLSPLVVVLRKILKDIEPNIILLLNESFNKFS